MYVCTLTCDEDEEDCDAITAAAAPPEAVSSGECRPIKSSLVELSVSRNDEDG